jgi:hypothetical protein
VRPIETPPEVPGEPDPLARSFAGDAAPLLQLRLDWPDEHDVRRWSTRQRLTRLLNRWWRITRACIRPAARAENVVCLWGQPSGRPRVRKNKLDFSGLYDHYLIRIVEHCASQLGAPVTPAPPARAMTRCPLRVYLQLCRLVLACALHVRDRYVEDYIVALDIAAPILNLQPKRAVSYTYFRNEEVIAFFLLHKLGVQTTVLVRTFLKPEFVAVRCSTLVLTSDLQEAQYEQMRGPNLSADEVVRWSNYRELADDDAREVEPPPDADVVVVASGMWARDTRYLGEARLVLLRDWEERLLSFVADFSRRHPEIRLVISLHPLERVHAGAAPYYEEMRELPNVAIDDRLNGSTADYRDPNQLMVSTWSTAGFDRAEKGLPVVFFLCVDDYQFDVTMDMPLRKLFCFDEATLEDAILSFTSSTPR